MEQQHSEAETVARAAVAVAAGLLTAVAMVLAGVEPAALVKGTRAAKATPTVVDMPTGLRVRVLERPERLPPADRAVGGTTPREATLPLPGRWCIVSLEAAPDPAR